MPEMRLRKPGFTYSTCGPFPKNKIRSVAKFGGYQRDLASLQRRS